MGLATPMLMGGLQRVSTHLLEPIILSRNSKIELLAIALCSVIVLALDLFAQKQLFLSRRLLHFWASECSMILRYQEVGILGRLGVLAATG